MNEPMEVKFLDLQRLNASFEPQLTDAVCRVIRSGWYLQGTEVSCFEEAFARYCGTHRCVCVGSGLDALTLILLAYRAMGRLQPGDEVIVPANTFVATIMAVQRAGLKAVLCEPLAATANMDVAAAERLMTPRTRVLLPVHLYGRLADMEAALRLTRKYGLLLVEDAAQAHGASLGGKRAGSWGDAAAFSFYPAKNLGALGDGGAVTTDDPLLADTVRTLANYGSPEKHRYDYLGMNSRMDEWQAAALSVKLPRLDADNARRRSIALRYLNGIRWSDRLTHLPEAETPEENVWHVFPVFVSGCRTEFQEFLAGQGIQTQLHYKTPPHRQPLYREKFGHLSLPVTERLHAEEVSLPISPLLTEGEVGRVIDAVNGWIARS